MALNREAVGGVVNIVGRIVAGSGSVSQEVVQAELTEDEHLRELVTPKFVEIVTHTGNVAAGGINRGGNESLLDKVGNIAKRVFKKEVTTHEQDATTSLIGSLTPILEALAERPEYVKYGTDAMKMLEKKGLLPEGYRYTVNLLGKLMILADLLPKE